MGGPDVEQAKRRLHEILQRAKLLRLSTREVLSTRPANKLLARMKNAFIWTIFLGIFLLIFSGFIYVYWPSQEVETVRTVWRHTDSNILLEINGMVKAVKFCGSTASTSNEFSERVTALLHTSTTQDDC
ncbi:hypothetical protein PV327_005719 [Microctonus hyperodae]|uniref:Uncharacterized protein n=1 Tax=Microctonus hyperodae TaxID=165561 RepID=A0AA39G2E5_MICHY|nr:hypothetical protein PV327_005719 [Microctonus hyperodae]